MALEISYSSQFVDNLESILTFYDERNGSDRFSKKLMKMINKQISLLKTMPEIGITEEILYIPIIPTWAVIVPILSLNVL